MDRFDPFVKYADVYGDIINWEKDPMNKPQNQNKYFFSDGKTYYEQICKMLRLMSVFKEAFNQIYSNEDEISEAWENFVNNLSASVVEGSEPDVTLTWTDDSVNFEFTMVPGVPGEQGVGITSISFNSDYTMTITLSDGNTYTSMSLKGETGPQGPQGETGSGLQILDVYATLADLQSAHPTGQPGDAYQVGSAGNYTLYIWSSSQSAWVPAGSLGTVSPSVSNPLMDGTASAGSSDLYSRGDHVHPSDTSRASKEELDALIKTSQSLIDQSFTYRESPAIQDGLARIDKIKGNTLVWNQQLLEPTTSAGATASANGGFRSNRCTFTYDSATHIITITTLENVGTSGFVFGLPNGAPLIVGHKYLQMCDVQAPKTFNFVIGINGNADVKTNLSANTYHHVSTIKEFSSSSNEFFFNFNNSNAWEGTETVYIKNTVMFDLTQMFGTGNEPATVEEFTSIFNLPYYNYNAGSLLNFNGTGLKTTGKNLLESANLQIGKNWAYGSASNRAIWEFDCEPNTKYHIDLDYSTTIMNVVVVYKVGHVGSQISNAPYQTQKHIDITTPNGCNVVCIQFEGSANISASDIYTINRAYLYGDENITSIPISTYFPTGMKRAGNVYDELTENRAITRIGAVDLGTLTWTYNSTYQWFSSTGINTTSKTYTDGVVPNAMCSQYTSVSASTMSNVSNDKALNINLYGNIRVRDTSYSDVATFTSAMSGVMLNYELATPTETTVDLDLSFQSYLDGTEQLLPVNGSLPSTSPILADMTYLSINDAMEYIIEKLANVPQNTQQILESLEDDVADLQTDVGALQPAVSALQTSVGNINTNIGQLSSTVAGHTSSISDIQSDISDLNTGLSDLGDTVTDNTSRIGTLETDLSTTDGQVKNLATSVSGLDSTVTAQGETVTALDNFVSNIANTRNPGYMSSDNSIGITSAFLNMTLAAGQSTWANIPLPTIMAGFIPLFVVGASTGDGSVCLFKIPSTYNQNNIYKVGVKNTSNSEITTQVGIEILCIKQRQSQ